MIIHNIFFNKPVLFNLIHSHKTQYYSFKYTLTLVQVDVKHSLKYIRWCKKRKSDWGQKEKLDVSWFLDSVGVVWVKLMGVAAVLRLCPLGRWCHTRERRCRDYKKAYTSCFQSSLKASQFTCRPSWQRPLAAIFYLVNKRTVQVQINLKEVRPSPKSLARLKWNNQWHISNKITIDISTRS